MSNNHIMFVIWSKPFCPYCVKAKNFMMEHKLPYVEKLLDPENDNYIDEKDNLITKAGKEHKTFPFIFLGDSFIGGYSELMNAFNTLKLHEMCKYHGIELEYDF